MRPIRVTKLINSMTQYRSRRKRNSMSHKAFPTCLPREHPRRKRMSRSPSMGGRLLHVKGFLNQVFPTLSSFFFACRAVFQSRTSSWLTERRREKRKVLKRRRGSRGARKIELDFQNLERGIEETWRFVRSNYSISFFFSATQPLPNPFLSFVS